MFLTTLLLSWSLNTMSGMSMKATMRPFFPPFQISKIQIDPARIFPKSVLFKSVKNGIARSNTPFDKVPLIKWNKAWSIERKNSPILFRFSKIEKPQDENKNNDDNNRRNYLTISRQIESDTFPIMTEDITCIDENAIPCKRTHK